MKQVINIVTTSEDLAAQSSGSLKFNFSHLVAPTDFSPILKGQSITRCSRRGVCELSLRCCTLFPRHPLSRKSGRCCITLATGSMAIGRVQRGPACG
jgi:hypothetical protein